MNQDLNLNNFETASNLNIPAKAKFAVVIAKTIEKASIFIETVALNRSINIRNFTSRDEAVAWLTE